MIIWLSTTQCYDAIPRPAGTLLCGGSPVKPLEITEINRPSLLNFSEIALNYYNEVRTILVLLINVNESILYVH
jgi:hypothetical protein